MPVRQTLPPGALFFFQAEDGIRDLTVTGVQTCALPICYCVAVEQLARANASLWNVIGGSAGLCGTAIDIGGPDALRKRYLPDLLSARKIEIGRASCRERV